MLEDYSTNNPAVCVPASHQLYQGKARASRRRHDLEDEEELAFDGVSGDSTVEDAIPATTKYDVGWRRIVRNFSPS